MDTLAMKDVDGREVAIDGATIDRFVSGIEGEVLFAGDPGYEDARKVWNAMIDRRPSMIVRCAGERDIVACVRLAAKHGLLVSVRGGGHNVAGNAVNDGGLVIDLSGMREVVVHEESMSATVQGGARLGDVDQASQRFGSATPLGVMPSTGVAGLALHGGLGWLLRRFGTTADNMVGARIVTADGSLLTVNENENKDLLWALRGGGGNFGVVTSFELRLHRLGTKVQACLVLFSMEDVPEVLPRFAEIMVEAPDELTARAQLWSAPTLPPVPPEMVGTPSLAVIACYSGPLDRGEAVLEPLKRMGAPLAELTMPLEHLEMQRFTSSFLGEGRASRHYWRSIFLSELSGEAADVIKRAAEDRPSRQSSIMIYPLGGAFARLGADAAFDNRDQQAMVALEADWSSPGDDDRNIAWARRWFEALRRDTTARVYLNFPGLAEEARMVEDSFAGNLARLRKIKARYDPENLFRGHLDIRPTARRPGNDEKARRTALGASAFRS